MFYDLALSSNGTLLAELALREVKYVRLTHFKFVYLCLYMSICLTAPFWLSWAPMACMMLAIN